MARLDAFFRKMLELEASDLHLTTGAPPAFRIHGDIHPVEGTEHWNAEQMQQEHDTDFAYELPGEGRFRANFFMDRTGPGAVFRLIPSEILTFEQLGLPDAVRNLCFLSKGLVVVTGPTGSGKSTTLAAMIDLINKSRAEHIITIEDPIEFVHQDHQVPGEPARGRNATPSSFKRALRAALREDPDIVLVGEMRDLETIEIAIETAETGHLVFGTLHTTTAASTVDRIIDQFPSERQAQIRTMLSSSLKGVVAQTLCKKQPKGRVAALEILLGNQAVASLVREGKTHQLISQMQIGGKVGMRLLNDSLIELVQQGVVAPGEAYLKAVNKEELLNKFSHIGVNFDPSQLESAAPAAPNAPAQAPLNTAPPRRPCRRRPRRRRRPRPPASWRRPRRRSRRHALPAAAAAAAPRPSTTSSSSARAATRPFSSRVATGDPSDSPRVSIRGLFALPRSQTELTGLSVVEPHGPRPMSAQPASAPLPGGGFRNSKETRRADPCGSPQVAS